MSIEAQIAVKQSRWFVHVIMNDDADYQDLESFKNTETCVAAVSYTHLDVYKRQRLILEAFHRTIFALKLELQ